MNAPLQTDVVGDRRRESPFHGADEVRQAAEALTRVDLKRLWAVSRVIIGGYHVDRAGRDYDDLVSEAFLRTLDGSRRWKRGVGFLHHLAEVMRSVACDWKLQESRAALWSRSESAMSAAANVPNPGPSAESVAETRDELQHLIGAFSDDAPARAVIEGWAVGYKSPEIMERHGMSKKEFQTAVRRVRRFAQRGDSHARRK